MAKQGALLQTEALTPFILFDAYRSFARHA